jgi:hypothetical protein
VPQQAERDFSLGHQIQEERPDVFEPELVDGLSEELGVVLDAPNVVALGLRGEPSELEILDEPLTHGGHAGLLGSSPPTTGGENPEDDPARLLVEAEGRSKLLKPQALT